MTVLSECSVQGCVFLLCVFSVCACVHVTGASVQLIRAYVHGRSAAAVRAVLRGAGHGRVLSPVLHSRSSELHTRRIVPFTTATLYIAIATAITAVKILVLPNLLQLYQGLCHCKTGSILHGFN